ncbi:exo-alpha-sialidase [Niameybacter massiliensis]|uniref:exo-alpha-sialidase n=1 Tax=Holtiella tumoricola TaxID=3018743 RepID=A0AA42J176_9FIRM|nr:sialidase domain-containing protein [Holtiella tumoricola]MDA3731913.1 exo-alpha-sialidase [Holtiella tumoricola]
MRKNQLKKFSYVIIGSLLASTGSTVLGEPLEGTIPYPKQIVQGEYGTEITTPPAYIVDLENMNNQVPSSPIIDKSNISIVAGQVYDLGNESAVNEVYSATEGSIFIEYKSTGTGAYQSLMSVSNTSTGNQDRHFHLYVTPSGTLGMELRNTDALFKYTMSAPNTVSALKTNKIAFKADATTKEYKLFANGSLVVTLSKADFKYFADIMGANNISLGGTVRQGSVAYPFEGTITQAKLYNGVLSDQELLEMTTPEVKPPVQGLLLEKSNVEITPGTGYDLTNEVNAEEVQTMSEGTIIASFTSTSNANIQSIFSIGNSTSGNRDRHFHIYATNTGAIGMELRNTDGTFKHILSRPAVLQGKYKDAYATNTIALKADAINKEYKLFANGDLIGTLKVDNFKFINDITGVNNVTLGGTIRENTIAYPFGGTINNIKVYNMLLSDEELLQATSDTSYGTKIFYAGDGTNSNYYRIPTLLTLKSGTVVSSIDARYGGTHDAKSNIDIAFAKSLDGGVTWSAPTLPMVFDDYASKAVEWPRDSVGKNVQIVGSAAFIDSVLLQDRINGRLFLFADAFPAGQGFNTAAAGTGFKVINGKKYVKLRWHGDTSSTYNYSIRENGVIYNDIQNTPTDYSVDGEYRLKLNGEYLTQKQYQVRFEGTTLREEKNNTDVRMSVFYKDSHFQMMPTNYLVMKYSDNEGETWSDMKIMGEFKDINSRMILFGPGVGTQIQNGPYAGRLLISAYNSKSGEFGYLYSDDHGDNWGFIPTDIGDRGSFAEAQIVEMPDGSLKTYMRTNIGKIGYISSDDGGMTWSPMAYIEGITVASYGTQISAINYSKPINGKKAILLSAPTGSSGRRGGKILVGMIEDTGIAGRERYTINWAHSYEVDLPTYGFSYSCMTELPNGEVGILYEKYDSWSRDELHLKNIMRYERYTIDELIK